MALALVPHIAATPDTLHVWVGVTDAGADAVPTLSWKLDNVAVEPRARRALAPVLTGNLAGTAPVVYTGFFTLTGLTAATSYRVEVSTGTEGVTRDFTTPPARVPEGPQDRLNVLLLSCFHRLEDKTGVAGQVLSGPGAKPHVTLFAGDQVYLDLPTLQEFQDDPAWLAAKFQDDYRNTWIGDSGYARVLSLAPAAFMPDDHEYWNNYPFWTTPVQNSWSPQGRANWKQAAEATYRAFQQAAEPFGTGQTIDIAPLSILMLDTRSQRSQTSRDEAGDLLGQPGMKTLKDWVTRLVDHARDPEPWFGMLVAGQSYFRPAAGTFQGAVADYEFADYPADYKFTIEQIERVTQAGLPIILATGDVHWSRVLQARDGAVPGAPIFEVISSATSLVSSVGADQVKQIWGVIKGLAGAANDWPRHSEPGNPPERFGTRKQYTTEVLERVGGGPAAMRGNQALMLRFQRAGRGGLDVEVACQPLSGRPEFDTAHQWSTVLQLRPPR
jgi:hypothetical protein